MKKILLKLLEDAVILLILFFIITIFFKDSVKAVASYFNTPEDIIQCNEGEDLVFSFNAMSIDPEGHISFTDVKETYVIYADSIASNDKYIGFAYNPIDFEINGISPDSMVYRTVAAYDIQTEKLLPIIYNDDGNKISAYVYIGDTSKENVGLIFSGCLYDESCTVVDDYILKQSVVSDSIITRVKLF